MLIQTSMKTKLDTPGDIVRMLRAVLATEEPYDQDKEHFWVIGLTSLLTMKYLELVSLGTATNAIVHAREVFRMAIAQGAIRIVIAHNHPGGSTRPSDHDITLTKTLCGAGNIVGIPVLDHIIFGNENGDGWYSFSEYGTLPEH